MASRCFFALLQQPVVHGCNLLPSQPESIPVHPRAPLSRTPASDVPTRGDLLTAEGPYGVKDGTYRVALVIGFYSCHKGYFVFRTATGFTTWVLAPMLLN